MRAKTQKKELSSTSILDTIYAFRSSRVLLTAYELGLFTAIGDAARTAAEVSVLIKTNVRATDRLMDALCGWGS